ncbi:MAG: LexA family transcriptional regulator [Saprospiraceae bacterium]|nr:LexA family transcriptional regulator [Saprospiraceae bacterium]
MASVVTERFIKIHNKLKDDNTVRSSRQFAISLDYLPQSLSEILKGRRDVTIELIRKAVEVYQLNPNYLFSGEGPMLINKEEQQSFRLLTIVTNSQDDERIVHVPVPAQAGYASGISDPTFVQDLPTFTLPDYKYKVGTHRSFDVSGDSMEPTLFEGDKVVCSFIEPNLWATAIKDNYVYVIVTRGDVVVKRVFNQMKLDQSMELQSDNEYYQPYRIHANDIREIWYVRAKISPFLASPQNAQDLMHNEIKDLKRMVGMQIEMVEELRKDLDQESR